MEDYITPIKTQLDEAMHLHCSLFRTIGSENETPRYYNFKSYDLKSQVLTIGSTQTKRLFFQIDCKGLNFGYLESSDFWQQFKEYRTDFLRKNYSTISVY